MSLIQSIKYLSKSSFSAWYRFFWRERVLSFKSGIPVRHPAHRECREAASTACKGWAQTALDHPSLEWA